MGITKKDGTLTKKNKELVIKLRHGNWVKTSTLNTYCRLPREIFQETTNKKNIKELGFHHAVTSIVRLREEKMEAVTLFLEEYDMQQRAKSEREEKIKIEKIEKIKKENKLAEEIQVVFLGNLNDKFDVFCSKLSVFLKEKNISLEKSTFFNVAKIIRMNLKNT